MRLSSAGLTILLDVLGEISDEAVANQVQCTVCGQVRAARAAAAVGSHLEQAQHLVMFVVFCGPGMHMACKTGD